jgi:glycosyltransferase involved in cell wall biosynthesis
MDVTVLIATYNHAEILRGALDALARQETAPGLTWELVVVDNNSGDHTRQVVEEMRARIPAPVRYVFERTQGKSFALNAGIRLIAGDVVCLTDDDCRPAPSWVQASVDALPRWDAEVVGGRILPAWASAPPAWLARDSHLKMMLALLEDAAVREVELGPWERGHGFRIWGANMCVRRTMFDSVGGFDPSRGPIGNKRYIGEDADFVRRAVVADKKVVFDPALLVWHYVPPERMAKRYFRKYAFDRGEGATRVAGASTTRHVLGVRPYVVTHLLADGARWLRSLVRRDPEAFCLGLEVLEDCGHLLGYVKKALAAGELASLSRRAGKAGA